MDSSCDESTNLRERRDNRRPSRKISSFLDKKAPEHSYTAPPIVRKYRRKEIEKTFGKYAYRPLPNLIFGTQNQFRGVRKTSITSGESDRGCSWSFIFDPSGRLAYWWSSVVSIAFTYNLWVIIYRCVRI